MKKLTRDGNAGARCGNVEPPQYDIFLRLWGGQLGKKIAEKSCPIFMGNRASAK